MEGKNHTILMIGWEYPPHNSGGLGVASQAIAEKLTRKGNKIILTLPQPQEVQNTPGVEFLFANIDSGSSQVDLPALSYAHGGGSAEIGQEIISKILEYARQLQDLVRGMDFDFVHAHDWLTFPAALNISKATGKPLYTHMHATEFDRAGSSFGNSAIHSIEEKGLAHSTKIFAVSEYTRQTILAHYDVAPEKVRVVYNGVTSKQGEGGQSFQEITPCEGKKTVLFVGRLTLQKGVDWFLRAAKIVLLHRTDVVFMITGSGDQQGKAVELAAELGIGSRVIFTGFMRDSELRSIYKNADVFVMPSVSEPFGITALEAATYSVPVIVSRTSGVSEVMHGAMKVDFWNTKEMAHKILGVLDYSPLSKALQDQGDLDVRYLTWERSINNLLSEYSF